MNKFVPLRSFIFDRLYNPSGGYFCRKSFHFLIQIFKLVNYQHQSIINHLLALMIINNSFINVIQKMHG